jgi:DNA-binding PadR family transcriptional regulator
MKVEITVLGLLSDSNLYGYEIQKNINERVDGFLDINFGSIYYVLKKGIKNGWIKKIGINKEPGRPERHTFQILPEGRARYKKLIKKYFNKNFLHFDVDIVLMFYNTLTEEQKKQFIEDRVSLVKDKLLLVKDKISNCTSASSKNSLMNFYTYLETHLKAEQAWLKTLK